MGANYSKKFSYKYINIIDINVDNIIFIINL